MREELRQCRAKGSALLQIVSQRLLQGHSRLSHLSLTVSDFLYLLTSSAIQICSLHLHFIDSTSGAEDLWRLPIGLKRLWIEGGNGIEQLYQSVDELGKKQPWALADLQTLRLEGVRVDRDGEVKVGKVVKRLRVLERLELVNCGVANVHCEALGEALLRLPSLGALSLDCNPLHDSGLLLLSTALPSLLSLSLNSCQISKVGLTALLASLSATTETLELASNALAGEAMEGFEVYARNLQGIQKLDLSGNDIGPEGVQHLVSFLRTVKKLKSLRLNCNYIGCVGFAYMLTAYYMRHLDGE